MSVEFLTSSPVHLFTNFNKNLNKDFEKIRSDNDISKNFQLY